MRITSLFGKSASEVDRVLVWMTVRWIEPCCLARTARNASLAMTASSYRCGSVTRTLLALRRKSVIDCTSSMSRRNCNRAYCSPRYANASSNIPSSGFHECRLIPDVDAERFRLVELRPGAFAGDDDVDRFRDPGSDPAAERLDPLLRLVAGHRGERPGEDERFA